MPTDQIVALLIAERDKLNRAIEALGGPTKRRGRPPKNPVAAAVDYNDPTMPDWVKPASARQPAVKKRGRTFSAYQRKKQAERMKAYWAAKKKAEAKPQPKVAKKTKKTPLKRRR
jgi:hypothetical protein